MLLFYSEIAVWETVLNRTHVRIEFLLRMADTVASQNIKHSSWDNPYFMKYVSLLVNLFWDILYTRIYQNIL
jgi:hypothetical protein